MRFFIVVEHTPDIDEIVRLLERDFIELHLAVTPGIARRVPSGT
jgi:hypothetical protein